MNLQEQISRINTMIGVINEDKKISYIHKSFDKVFNKLELIKDYEDLKQFDWVDKNDHKVFERNHWGMLWVYDCDEYNELKKVPFMLNLTYTQFKKILLGYLNNKYESEFGDKPLIDMGYSGNQNCDEYDRGFFN